MTSIKICPVFFCPKFNFWAKAFFKTEINDLRMMTYFSFILVKIQNSDKDYSTSETKFKILKVRESLKTKLLS